MSRPQRGLKKKFIVFCEGDTEFHYIEQMRKNQGVQVTLKLINMRGGGYSNFLDKLKTEAQSNCLAKFIIIDGDRLQKHFGEKEKFRQLVEYCRLQNNRGAIPHFLIVDNPDFEYAACLHVPTYKEEDIEKFIKNVLGFQSIGEFKNKKDIFEFLNSSGKSYKNMLSRIRGKAKFVKNEYLVRRQSFEIFIKKTVVDWDQINVKSSNLEEFFDVIDW